MFDELEATNRIIRILGETKVETIDEYEESSIANDILNEKKNKVLSRGWYFNTNEEFEIVRDIDGFIQLPIETLKIEDIETSDTGEVINAVIRGTRLYNKAENSFVFENDIKCNLTINMDFDDLVIQAKEYITCLAAETYSNNMDGSETLYKLNQKSLETAFMELFEMDLDSRNIQNQQNEQLYRIRDYR